MTDAQGNYAVKVPPGNPRIDDVTTPVPRMLYHARNTPFAYAGQKTVVAGHRVELSAVLKPGGALKVAARNKAGQPIKDLEIKLRRRPGVYWNPPQGTPVSGEDGAVVCYGLEPGLCVADVLPPKGADLAPARGLPIRIEEGRITGIDLVLSQGATLQGRITDRGGKALAANGLKMLEQEIVEDGGYRVAGLRSGFHLARPTGAATLAWKWPDDSTARVVGGLAHVLNLAPEPSPSVQFHGRVTDTEGQPIENARVIRYSYAPGLPTRYETSTDKDGTYRFEPPRTSGTVETLRVIPQRDQALVTYTRYIQVKDTPPFDCKLEPGIVVKLTVRTEAGEPIPGVAFQYNDNLKGPNRSSGQGGQTNPSDGDGLIAVRLGLRSADMTGMETRSLELKPALGGHTPEPRDLALPLKPAVLEYALSARPGASITGKVTTPRGEPAFGARVMIQTRDQYEKFRGAWGAQNTSTDATGTFRFLNVEPGEYFLGVRSSQSCGEVLEHGLITPEFKPVTIIAGQPATVDFKLEPGASIEGWLITEGGEKVAGSIFVQPAGGRHMMDVLTQASDPATNTPYAVRALPAGEYRIRALPSVSPWREMFNRMPEETVTLAAGQALKKDYRLPKADGIPQAPAAWGAAIDRLTDEAMAKWAKVRLESMRLTIRAGAQKAQFKGEYALTAQEKVEGVLLAFPLPAWQRSRDEFRITVEGKEDSLSLVPFLDQRAYMGRGTMSSTAWQRYGLHALHGEATAIRNVLSGFFEYWNVMTIYYVYVPQNPKTPYEATWQAARLDLEPGKPEAITVEATIYPYQLTPAAEGPAYAFRFPARVPGTWAGLPPTLDATIALDETLRPEDVIAARPEGITRDGRTFTLSSKSLAGLRYDPSQEHAMPTEDLFIAVRGTLPDDLQQTFYWKDEPVDIEKYVAEMKLKPVPGAVPAPAVPPAGPSPAEKAQAFQKQLEGLKDIVWKAQDTVDANFTWFGLKEGLAMADAGKQELEQFRGLLNFDSLVVRTVAFSPKEVWLATDKGLISWHRTNRFWSLNAPGADVMNVAVQSVEMKDGKLRATYEVKDKPGRVFEYDFTTKQWREMAE
jgi:hypothetical protein